MPTGPHWYFLRCLLSLKRFFFVTQQQQFFPSVISSLVWGGFFFFLSNYLLSHKCVVLKAEKSSRGEFWYFIMRMNLIPDTPGVIAINAMVSNQTTWVSASWFLSKITGVSVHFIPLVSKLNLTPVTWHWLDSAYWIWYGSLWSLMWSGALQAQQTHFDVEN